MKSSPISALLFVVLFLVALVAGASKDEMNAMDTHMTEIEMDAVNDIDNEVCKISAMQRHLNSKMLTSVLSSL